MVGVSAVSMERSSREWRLMHSGGICIRWDPRAAHSWIFSDVSAGHAQLSRSCIVRSLEQNAVFIIDDSSRTCTQILSAPGSGEFALRHLLGETWHMHLTLHSVCIPPPAYFLYLRLWNDLRTCDPFAPQPQVHGRMHPWFTASRTSRSRSRSSMESMTGWDQSMRLR